jgi:hypothetical protein
MRSSEGRELVLTFCSRDAVSVIEGPLNLKTWCIAGSLSRRKDAVKNAFRLEIMPCEV